MCHERYGGKEKVRSALSGHARQEDFVAHLSLGAVRRLEPATSSLNEEGDDVRRNKDDLEKSRVQERVLGFALDFRWLLAFEGSHEPAEENVVEGEKGCKNNESMLAPEEDSRDATHLQVRGRQRGTLQCRGSVPSGCTSQPLGYSIQPLQKGGRWASKGPTCPPSFSD